jgi:hypothetical protein
MSREDWEAGLELCPLEERPEYLRSRHGPAGRMKLTKLIDTGTGTLIIYFCMQLRCSVGGGGRDGGGARRGGVDQVAIGNTLG